MDAKQKKISDYIALLFAGYCEWTLVKKSSFSTVFTSYTSWMSSCDCTSSSQETKSFLQGTSTLTCNSGHAVLRAGRKCELTELNSSIEIIINSKLIHYQLINNFFLALCFPASLALAESTVKGRSLTSRPAAEVRPLSALAPNCQGEIKLRE